MKFGPGHSREMRGRLTAILHEQSRIARDQAKLIERQSELIGELLTEPHGPTPAEPPARVVALRVA